MSDEPRAERELDIVLFGATGFVGRLIAEHLVAVAPTGVRIGLAGRSQERLRNLRIDLGPRAGDWPLILADSDDGPSLTALAGRTRVVATTVGPYAKYGLALVEACAAAGTHYCDLTGEVLFVRRSIDTCDALAKASGARIVHACGFDSIPSDLGVFATAARARADGQGELTRTTLYVRSMRGGFSGGTIDSMRQQVRELRDDPAARQIASDTYALSPSRADEPAPSRPSPPDPTAPEGPWPLAAARRIGGSLTRSIPVWRDGTTGRWAGPFVMASFNTRIVRRSNALLDWVYGRDFRYQEVSDYGSGPTAPLTAGLTTAGLLGALGGLSFAPTRAVLDRLLPKPGEGPSPQAQAKGRFRMEIHATTTTGAHYRTRVGMDKDPGYGGTAVMFGQAALCLAEDEAVLPPYSGVLTPAVAMGEALAARLRSHGFTLTTERLDT